MGHLSTEQSNCTSGYIYLFLMPLYSKLSWVLPSLKEGTGLRSPIQAATRNMSYRPLTNEERKHSNTATNSDKGGIRFSETKYYLDVSWMTKCKPHIYVLSPSLTIHLKNQDIIIWNDGLETTWHCWTALLNWSVQWVFYFSHQPCGKNILIHSLQLKTWKEVRS